MQRADCCVDRDGAGPLHSPVPKALYNHRIGAGHDGQREEVEEGGIQQEVGGLAGHVEQTLATRGRVEVARPCVTAVHLSVVLPVDLNNRERNGSGTVLQAGRKKGEIFGIFFLELDTKEYLGYLFCTDQNFGASPCSQHFTALRFFSFRSRLNYHRDAFSNQTKQRSMAS